MSLAAHDGDLIEAVVHVEQSLDLAREVHLRELEGVLLSRGVVLAGVMADHELALATSQASDRMRRNSVSTSSESTVTRQLG